MGTRAAFGFRVDGVDKVTYRHCDGYPEHLGIRILKGLRGKTLDELRAVAAAVQMVDKQVAPTPEQIEQCRRWANTGVATGSMNDWYCLLRNAQSDLNAWMDGLRYMIDDGAFLHDSLFCEYAYIVNVDTASLEVYRGFNKDPQAAGRYAGKRTKTDREYEYFGVVLHKEIPLEVCFSFIPKQAEREIASWFPTEEEEVA